MVAINEIGGIPEPKPERSLKVRDGKKPASSKAEQVKDGVLISSEAQAAASVARAINATKADPIVRADRVASAKEHIDRGDYKDPEVVAKVAERISKYLP